MSGGIGQCPCAGFPAAIGKPLHDEPGFDAFGAIGFRLLVFGCRLLIVRGRVGKRFRMACANGDERMTNFKTTTKKLLQ